MTVSVAAAALFWSLALTGVDYEEVDCRAEATLHLACDIVQPSPLTAPADFDRCFVHEVRCHLRP